jgi:hypothetical protein
LTVRVALGTRGQQALASTEAGSLEIVWVTRGAFSIRNAAARLASCRTTFTRAGTRAVAAHTVDAMTESAIDAGLTGRPQVGRFRHALAIARTELSGRARFSATSAVVATADGGLTCARSALCIGLTLSAGREQAAATSLADAAAFAARDSTRQLDTDAGAVGTTGFARPITGAFAADTVPARAAQTFGVHAALPADLAAQVGTDTAIVATGFDTRVEPRVRAQLAELQQSRRTRLRRPALAQGQTATLCEERRVTRTFVRCWAGDVTTGRVIGGQDVATARARTLLAGPITGALAAHAVGAEAPVALRVVLAGRTHAARLRLSFGARRSGAPRRTSPARIEPERVAGRRAERAFLAAAGCSEEDDVQNESEAPALGTRPGAMSTIGSRAHKR